MTETIAAYVMLTIVALLAGLMVPFLAFALTKLDLFPPWQITVRGRVFRVKPFKPPNPGINTDA